MSYQDLSIYFFEELSDINNKRGNKLSDYCVGYLSELLITGIHRDFTITDNKKKYLVDIYKKGIEAEGKHQRCHHFKHLGDYSLIISGYFTSSIDKVEYYINMGSLGYHQTALLLSPEPYLELSRSYSTCVALLNELSTKNRHYKKNNLLEIYEFWNVTQSQCAKEKLLKLGMLTDTVEE